MKRYPLLSLFVTLAIAAFIAACGSGSAGTLGIEALDDVSGVRVVADGAGADQSATASNALTVGEQDMILISPDMEKGSFHLTISTQDGSITAFDEEVSGRVLFTVDATPESYDVTATGHDATGSVVVCAQSLDELAAQEQSLGETLGAIESEVERLT